MSVFLTPSGCRRFFLSDELCVSFARYVVTLWLSTWLRVLCGRVVSISGTLFSHIVMVFSLQ